MQRDSDVGRIFQERLEGDKLRGEQRERGGGGGEEELCSLGSKVAREESGGLQLAACNFHPGGVRFVS